MKKVLLAVAITSAFASAAATAATVYENDDTKLSIGGRAEVRGVFSDDFEGTMEDASRARINFGGETKISEGLTGFGFMEYQLEPNSKMSNRYLYAGLGTTVGKFSYGKQDTSNVIISDMTDIASEHSGQQQIIDASKDKQENTFLYQHTIADMFTVNANYNAVDEKDGDSFGISGLASLDFGLDLGLAYSSEEDLDQITLGAAYTLDNLYLGATYATVDLDEGSFNSVELAAEYKFTSEFRLIGIYGFAEHSKADEKDTDFFALEGQYRFNSSIRTYASYKIDNVKDANNELMVGLRYNF
ncbi:porin [Vibrio ulleungensis]|uniref:Porin n=1 Tax=Vibrio ulleungensis TaxID=2807619 RepID=A0ABS2HCY2_9VIBR|nr:porin [Vibrio ulleungensis]MBM7035455.1 porin [Vibrio ulleungensis]